MFEWRGTYLTEYFSKSSKSMPELKRINILTHISNYACLVQIKSATRWSWSQSWSSACDFNLSEKVTFLLFIGILACADQLKPFAGMNTHLSRTPPQGIHTLGFSPETLDELFWKKWSNKEGLTGNKRPKPSNSILGLDYTSYRAVLWRDGLKPHLLWGVNMSHRIDMNALSSLTITPWGTSNWLCLTPAA